MTADSDATLWAAISAMASATAAALMWATLRDQRRHNRLSVQPRLQFAWHAGEGDSLGAGLILENNGLGAAILDRFQINVAGQRLFGEPRSVWSEAALRIEALAQQRGIPLPLFRTEQYALDVGASLAAGDRRLLWGVRPGGLPEMSAAQRRHLFGFFADTIEVQVDYRSIYGENVWRLDSAQNLPQLVTGAPG